MNAYELADELEAAPIYMSFEGEAASMLRQQADRIAELEKQLTFQPNQTLACPSYLSNLTPQTKPRLSDEELHELIINKVTDYDLCRAIEERHGIK